MVSEDGPIVRSALNQVGQPPRFTIGPTSFCTIWVTPARGGPPPPSTTSGGRGPGTVVVSPARPSLLSISTQRVWWQLRWQFTRSDMFKRARNPWGHVGNDTDRRVPTTCVRLLSGGSQGSAALGCVPVMTTAERPWVGRVIGENMLIGHRCCFRSTASRRRGRIRHRRRGGAGRLGEPSRASPGRCSSRSWRWPQG